MKEEVKVKEEEKEVKPNEPDLLQRRKLLFIESSSSSSESSDWDLSD